MDFPYSKIYRLPPERPNKVNNLDYDDDDDTKARYEKILSISSHDI